MAGQAIQTLNQADHPVAMHLPLHESLDRARLQHKIDALSKNLEQLRVRKDTDADTDAERNTSPSYSYQEWTAMKGVNSHNYNHNPLNTQNANAHTHTHAHTHTRTRFYPDAQKWAKEITSPAPRSNPKPKPRSNLDLNLGLGLNPYAATPLQDPTSNWDASAVPYTLPGWAQPQGVAMRAAAADSFQTLARTDMRERYYSPSAGRVYAVYGSGCDARAPVWGRNGADDEMFDERMWR